MTYKTKYGFFDTNIAILKIACMWYPGKTEKSWVRMLYWIFNTPILLYSTCWFLPTEYIEFGYSFGDLDTLIKNVSIAAVHSVANLKLLMWLTHKDEILGMIGRHFFG